jgi:hypothetical protein
VKPHRVHSSKNSLRFGVPGLLVLTTLTACSSTTQTVLPNGDSLLRSGPTFLGWMSVIAAAIIPFAVLSVFLVVVTAIVGEESLAAFRSRRPSLGSGYAVLAVLLAGLTVLAGWAVAANTVFKHMTTVVVTDAALRELRVERQRLLGSDAVLRWSYGDVAAIEYDYIPGTGGESPRRPQGVVFVRPVDQERVRIFDGPACPARDLADLMVEASGASLDVHAGVRDLSGFGAFLRQLRCGEEQPFRPLSLAQYPREAWRVLDLPFLWHWPWAFPLIAAQSGIVVGVVVLNRARRDGRCRTVVLVTVCVTAAAALIALNVLAAVSHGRWPALLALVALVTGRFAIKQIVK